MPINKNAAFRFRIIDACLRNNMRKYPTLEVLKEVIMEAMNLDSISDSTTYKDIRQNFINNIILNCNYMTTFISNLSKKAS